MTDFVADLRNVWLLAISVVTAGVTLVAWGTRRASREDLITIQDDVHQLEVDVAAMKASDQTHRQALDKRLSGIEAGIKRIEDHLLKDEK